MGGNVEVTFVKETLPTTSVDPSLHIMSYLIVAPPVVRNGGAAAADPSRTGQRWKKKMEATNLRAAREVFRERNPTIKVGHTHDSGASVLKVR